MSATPTNTPTPPTPPTPPTNPTPPTTETRTTGPHERARSKEAFERAQRVMVGGVSSPVRAFAAVGGEPLFIERAQGARVWDVDGAAYIDLVGSWGPAIVGHAHPAVVGAVKAAADKGLSFGACCEAEAELAERILPALVGADLLRFVSSGTEAVMSAIRLARAATGRSLVVKFEGNYHGHSDGLLVAAGSGASTFGVPDSAGVPPEVAGRTLLAKYNDLASVDALLAAHGGDIAAILVEPVAGNMGFILPQDGFLAGLRARCDDAGALLVFDEVMTGFRVAWGGYQRLTEVAPDVTTLGKVIGGGMPVAAYAAREELMRLVSPAGPVYQAGTLSGNPLAMAAGVATLDLCRADGFYETLHARSTRLAGELRSIGEKRGLPVQTGALGGMLGLFFAGSPVRSYADAQGADHERYARFFRAMLDRGVFLPPSGYEAWFLSGAHGDDELAAIAVAADASMAGLT